MLANPVDTIRRIVCNASSVVSGMGHQETDLPRSNPAIWVYRPERFADCGLRRTDTPGHLILDQYAAEKLDSHFTCFLGAFFAAPV